MGRLGICLQGSQIDWSQQDSFTASTAILLHEPQRSFAGTDSTGSELGFVRHDPVRTSSVRLTLPVASQPHRASTWWERDRGGYRVFSEGVNELEVPAVTRHRRRSNLRSSAAKNHRRERSDGDVKSLFMHACVVAVMRPSKRT